ncbi:MAG: polymer-forming cytoskeletal protein [Geminicoccaceae bacterium]|nr:polymer-forming cytoskeletal protein [Geminicoccaceae bacterium]MCB2010094.1 polymer-forming cytoskeletal protein [Geminicoccaceae bacterium]
MFRRKDNDPVSPADGNQEPAFARPQTQPDMPRRQPEIPTNPSASAPSAAPASASPQTQRPTATQTDAQGKRLIVGQGISLAGEITACDRLVVEGSVQVTLNETRAIEIAESGRFTEGKAEVEEAEISGIYEGELTVRNRLLIRSTGQVKGTVRYGEIEIERGGRLQGSVSMLDGDGGI